LFLADRPATIDVGIEQLEAAATLAAGLADEVLLVTALAHQAVDRGGGVVVVGALVDIVIEMTGAQYRTVVVLGGEDLAEQADPVVHRRIAVEVAGAVVVVQRFQVAAVRAAGPEGIGVVGS